MLDFLFFIPVPAGEVGPVMLDNGEALEIKWKKNFARLTVLQNGQLLGNTVSKTELKLARSFQSIGGQYFTVVLSKHGDLEIWQKQRELLTGLGSGERDEFAIACSSLCHLGNIQFGIAMFFLFFFFDNWKVALPLGIFAVLGLGMSFFSKKAKLQGENRWLRMAWWLLWPTIVLLAPAWRAVWMHRENLSRGLRATPLGYSKRRWA